MLPKTIPFPSLLPPQPSPSHLPSQTKTTIFQIFPGVWPYTLLAAPWGSVLILTHLRAARSYSLKLRELMTLSLPSPLALSNSNARSPDPSWKEHDHTASTPSVIAVTLELAPKSHSSGSQRVLAHPQLVGATENKTGGLYSHTGFRGSQPRILYPAESFRFEGEIKKFPREAKAERVHPP